MNKKLVLTLVVAILLCMFSVCVMAEENIYDDGRFRLVINGTEMTISGNGKLDDAEWFWYGHHEVDWTYMTKVVIVPGITEISDNAFSGFSKLKSVSLPDTITRIGKNAFKKCVSLTDIAIPNSVRTIGESAFDTCTGLSKIEIPDSVMTIGKEAFDTCTGLISVKIPDSISRIPEEMFQKCKNLTSITIPNSVRVIDKEAFEGCKKLTSVKIPSSVTRICEEAFADCSHLTEITVPKSVTRIGSSAFAHCTRLTRIRIKGSPKFGEDVFDRTRQVTVVTFRGSNAEKYANEHQLDCMLSLPKPKLIRLDRNSATLYQKANASVRDKLQLVATRNWTGDQLTWTSSDPEVAKVSPKGLVTALKAGKTTITVSSEGASARCVITVKKNDAPIKRITATPEKITLKVGEKATIKLTFKPETAYNNAAKWTSSDHKVATVTSKGVITARGKGKCTVRATAINGRKVAIRVTVK